MSSEATLLRRREARRARTGSGNSPAHSQASSFGTPRGSPEARAPSGGGPGGWAAEVAPLAATSTMVQMQRSLQAALGRVEGLEEAYDHEVLGRQEIERRLAIVEGELELSKQHADVMVEEQARQGHGLEVAAAELRRTTAAAEEGLQAIEALVDTVQWSVTLEQTTELLRQQQDMVLREVEHGRHELKLDLLDRIAKQDTQLETLSRQWEDGVRANSAANGELRGVLIERIERTRTDFLSALDSAVRQRFDQQIQDVGLHRRRCRSAAQLVPRCALWPPAAAGRCAETAYI
eukprot:SAG11_NODE_4622_length_1831_cov_1.153002_2_plen_292_part_00